MILKTLTFQPDAILSLCTICITDNNGAKIALTIIVSTFIFLGVANWAFKKYLSNKKGNSSKKII